MSKFLIFLAVLFGALPIAAILLFFNSVPVPTFGGPVKAPYSETDKAYELALSPTTERGQKVTIDKNTAAITLYTANDAVALTLKPQLPTDTFDKTDRPFSVSPTYSDTDKQLSYTLSGVTTYIEPIGPSKVSLNFKIASRPSTEAFLYRLSGIDNIQLVYRGSPADEALTSDERGSYGVYHNSEKIMELARPKFIDANNVEEYGILYYFQDGTIQINAPQGYLDTAAYPFIITLPISL